VSILLNGIRRESPRFVTSDVAATPRATLKDGLVQHQWGVGLGSRMHPRFYGHSRPHAASLEFLVGCRATR